MNYFIRNYYTGELIAIENNFEKAIEIARKLWNTAIFDNENHCYCEFIDIPF